MLKRLRIASLLKYAIIPAVAYEIPAMIFIKQSTFTDTWWLYLGNGFFIFASFVLMLVLGSKKRDPSTPSMLATGHAIAILATLMTVVISVVAVMLLVPGFFGSGPAHKVLTDLAAESHGKTRGLLLMLILNALVGNISAGSFVAIILAYYSKADQTKDDPVVENLAG